MAAEIVDLFAGPGGWEEGAQALGIAPLGIEIEARACETATAAGHQRMHADVAALDPQAFKPVRGLIGSPPCPTFSAGGRGAGRHLMDVLARALRELAAGRDSRAATRAAAYEILEPLAWEAEQAAAAKKNRPTNRDQARDQARRDADLSVLVVEPLRWALHLEPEWIALEQVPAVLPLWRCTAEALNDLGYSCWAGVLEAERYGVPQTRERAVLMASRTRPVHPPRPTHQRYIPGEAPASEHTLEGSIEPWVSMADALGWGMTARPYLAVACSSSSGGPDMEKVGGSAARGVIYAEQAAGRWTQERPATTIQGDPRVFPPGHKVNGDDVKAGRGGQRRSGRGHTKAAHNRKRDEATAVRVTIEEAGVLQSFRPDYPWAGTSTEQFRQVGNAVPPLLARAILAPLVDGTHA